MAATSIALGFNSSIDVRLPQTPEVSDAVLYKELSIIYNAIKQLQYGVDSFLDIPPVGKDEDHILGLVDRGRSIDTSANVSVDLAANTDLGTGATIVVTNISTQEINISKLDDSIQLITAATTDIGDKLLAPFGVATLRYIGGDSWIILGAGLSEA